MENMIKYLISLCLISMFLASFVYAERAYILVPVVNGVVQFPMDSLTYTSTKLDTVWRDSTYMERHELDSAVVKVVRQKVVTRSVGGISLVAMRQIDSIHAIAMYFVYTKDVFMTRLENDPNLLFLSRPDSTERTDSLSAAEITHVEDFFTANGVKRSKVRNQEWFTYRDLLKSSRQILDITKAEMNACDIARRDD